MGIQVVDNAAQRKRLRAERRALSPAAQLAHSRTVTRALIGWGLFLRFDSLAIYIANDGELDPTPLANAAFSRDKKLFLPLLRPGRKKQLWFAPYTPHSRMVENRFGIPEPLVPRRELAGAQSIDAILLPLVGFDDCGNRLGMGGGYYDRTLAFLRLRKQWRKPLLIGLAHHCQRVSHITHNRWDVPLDLIVSERGVQTAQR